MDIIETKRKRENLTPKQRLFCDYYVIDLNATKAAKLAGYSNDSAYEIGSQNLKKVEIRSYIDEILSQKVISAEEAVKLTSDIAKSSINDYLTIKQREVSRKIKKPLLDKIEELRIEIKKERIICKKLNWETNEKKMEAHVSHILSLDEKIVRFEVDLQMNPEAYIIEYGEPELIDSVDIDLAKLAKDKELGRIKSLSYNEFGPKVELYAADIALTNMLKIHGKFEKDNRQKSPQFTLEEKMEKLKELEFKILESAKNK